MASCVSILFAGDFVPYERTKILVDKGEYDNIFSKELKEIVEKADYSVVNLEAPIKHSACHPIKKVGPILSAGENAPKALKYCGFNLATLANNHMNDYGEDGILNTILKCKESGLDVIGAGHDREESARPFVKNIGGRKIAFINCCEHEFSINKTNKPGCNPLDPISQSYVIKEAKNNAEYVVVVVHGGIEHYQLPTPRMQQTYRFFIDEGADVVINHHQHCYSGYEIYKDRPIVYGLGNFCFDWRTRMSKNWSEGYMARVEFSNSIKIELFPYIQNRKEVGVNLMNLEEKSLFNKELSRLNRIIAEEDALQIEYETFLSQTDKEYRAALSVYPGRIFTSLCRRGLLPVMTDGYRFRRMLLNISCESHLERLRHYLESRIKE
jgi:poly-gamma-glutamate synthesis protein (capsule biosynthesis protein)